MKKSISMIFCLVLLLGTMTGCSSSSKDVRPDDTDTNRPGVNDSVVTATPDVTATPHVTDNMMDDVENGMDEVGDAVRRSMEKEKNMIKDAVDDMTGK